MPLAADFQFTQANLQDYADCPRRFQLRYMLALDWPALVAEPADEHEAHLRAGEAFHRLVQQHVLGIISDDVSLEAGSSLASWWANYLASPPPELPATRFPEITLSAPLGSHRLVATFDLLAVEPGRRAVIVDWKTTAQRPPRAWLMARWQTRVYRYLLVQAGASWNVRLGSGLGQPFRPEQVEMIYWFAEQPDDPERLPYDATQYAADGRLLNELVAEIAARTDEVFPLTANLRHCRFCPYRSLCDRGREAGDLGTADEEVAAAEEVASLDWAASFDFEQVGEIPL